MVSEIPTEEKLWWIELYMHENFETVWEKLAQAKPDQWKQILMYQKHLLHKWKDEKVSKKIE